MGHVQSAKNLCRNEPGPTAGIGGENPGSPIRTPALIPAAGPPLYMYGPPPPTT